MALRIEGWCVLKGFDFGDETRLRRELGMLARLQHPHILTLQGVCRQVEPRFTYFLQFPLYPQNLRQYLDAPRDGESKEDRDLRTGALLSGLLEAIVYLHHMGCLHRDIKPENVLVSAEGRAVLADFETSNDEDSNTSTCTVTRLVASGPYTAPEVLKQGNSQPSDIFAFGVVVGEALINRIPTPAAVVAVPDDRLDAQQKKMLMAMLHADPAKRPTALKLLLQEPYFRGEPRMRTCLVCYDEYPLSEGTEIMRGQHRGQRLAFYMQLLFFHAR